MQKHIDIQYIYLVKLSHCIEIESISSTASDFFLNIKLVSGNTKKILINIIDDGCVSYLNDEINSQFN